MEKVFDTIGHILVNRLNMPLKEMSVNGLLASYLIGHLSVSVLADIRQESELSDIGFTVQEDVYDDANRNAGLNCIAFVCHKKIFLFAVNGALGKKGPLKTKDTYSNSYYTYLKKYSL